LHELLQQLAAGQALMPEQATEAFETIMTGQASAAQTASLLSLIAARGPSVDELVGAATVMRRHAISVAVPTGLTVIDTCGTGGDQSSTFNISTAAAIVTAAAGRPHDLAVAKHGNRSISSKSGSSQVLDQLGVKLAVGGDTLSQCLDEAGLCFCFAPAHHPAMKHAAPIRTELGFRTIFNMLGPLTNPAGAKKQLIGVYSPALTEPLADALQQLGAERVMVVNGQIPDADGQHIDALDELSTCGPTRVSEVHFDDLETYSIRPEELGLAYSHPSALRAEDVAASAAKVQAVLNGEAGPARDIVALNAAAALVVGGVARDLSEGLARACEAIDRGDAQRVLDTLVRLTRADPTPTG
jgi:anthranilate phosphoribosyltransferase